MAIGYVYIGLGVAIFILNFIEILIIVKRRKRIKPYEQLLSSLAVADALTGLIMLISKLFAISEVATNAHQHASNILSCIALTTVIISIACLASIAIDRILAVKYPLHHRRWVTKSRVWFIAILEWVVTWILVTIPILLGTFSSVLPDDMTQVYKKITSWMVIIFGVAFSLGYTELVRSLIMRPSLDPLPKIKRVKRRTFCMREKPMQIVAFGDSLKKTLVPHKQAGILVSSIYKEDGGKEKKMKPIQLEASCATEGPINFISSAIAVLPVDDKSEALRARAKSWDESDNHAVKHEHAEPGPSRLSLSTGNLKECGKNNITNRNDNIEAKKNDKNAKAKRKRERKLSRTVALTCALIVLTYLFCTTPYAIQILLGGDSLTGWTGLLLFSNSLFNPLIFFFKGYLENAIKKEKMQPEKINNKQKGLTKSVKFSTK